MAERTKIMTWTLAEAGVRNNLNKDVRRFLCGAVDKPLICLLRQGTAAR
jgi:hypothetical protein